MSFLSLIRKKTNVYFAVVAILTVVGILLWRLGTSDYADDFPYRHVCPSPDSGISFWNAPTPVIHTLSDAIDSSVNHYKINNCRLANIVCIFMMLLPRWLVNCIDTLIGILLFFLIFKVAQVKFKTIHPLTIILGTILFWTAFPWYEHMSSNDFYINYVWSSVVMLVAMWAFNRGAQLTRWQAVIACILGFLTVWMHEAFGCSLIAYSFFVWLLGGKRDMKVRFIIGVFMCLAIVVAMGRSTGARVEYCIDPNCIISLRYRFTQFASQMWPSCVAIAMTVWLRLTVGRKEFAQYKPKTIGCFAAIVVSLLISWIVFVLGRGLWPADLFAILQSIMCFDVIAKRRFKTTRCFGAIFACLAVLYAVWLTELVRWQWKFTDENNALFEVSEKADKQIVYYDLTQAEEVPFYLMGIVEHDWRGFFYMNFLAYYTQEKSGILLLPTKNKGVPLDDLSVPGSSCIKGVWPTFYAINDTTVHFFEIVVGEPTNAASPIDRALMKLTPKEGRILYRRDDAFDIEIDGNHYYYYTPCAHGRTLNNRRFLRIENEQTWEEFYRPQKNASDK